MVKSSLEPCHRIDRLSNSEVLELAPMNFITIVIIIINIVIIDMIIFTF